MAANLHFDERWLGASIPAEHWHFHRRLFRRYGIVLRVGEYSKLVRNLSNGRVLVVRTRPKRPAIIAVKIQGKRVFIMANGRRPMTAVPIKGSLIRKFKAAKKPKARGAQTT